MPKQYTTVAELLADTLDEANLRQWIEDLWNDRHKLSAQVKLLTAELKAAQCRFEYAAILSADRGVALSEIQDIVIAVHGSQVPETDADNP